MTIYEKYLKYYYRFITLLIILFSNIHFLLDTIKVCFQDQSCDKLSVSQSEVDMDIGQNEDSNQIYYLS